jgi:hypothetical protein
MAANVSIPRDEKLPFDKIIEYMLLGAQDALRAFTSSTKIYLIAYFGATILTGILDLIEFFT